MKSLVSLLFWNCTGCPDHLRDIASCSAETTLAIGSEKSQCLALDAAAVIDALDGMAYTSDLSERWGAEWLAWSDFGSFWAQAVRGVLRKTNSQGMEISDQKSLGTWNLDIKRLTSGGAPINDIHWDASALDESGQMYDVTVRQVGLGRYRAEVPLADHQNLTLRLRDQDHDKLKVLHYHRPYPAEYRLSSKLPHSLSDLESIEPISIRADITPVRRRKPVSHYFYIAAFACLWAGILLRRV